MKNFKTENNRGGFGFKRGGGGREFKKQEGGGGFAPRGGDFGGRPKFGGDKGGFKGNRDRAPRTAELFSAICSTCGKECEVPFRPSSDKPVYCSACFGKKSQDESRGFGDRNQREDRSDRNFKKDYKPEREPKREYGAQENNSSKAHEELKRQIVALETKINRLIELLDIPTTEVKVAVDAPKKERKPKTAAPLKKAAKKTAPKKAKKAIKAKK